MFSSLLFLALPQSATPPNANYDQVVNSGITFTVVIDVAANDTDPDGDLDPTSTLIYSQPGNGAALVRPDGQITYQAHAGWHGTDTLTYTISDLAGNTSNIATVEVESFNENAKPTAVYDQATCDAGGYVILNVGLNDFDSDGFVVGKTLRIESLPKHADVHVTQAGKVKFAPFPGWNNSTDTFTYSVEDNEGARSNIATVEVFTLPPPNINPLLSVDPAVAGQHTNIHFAAGTPNSVARVRFSLYGGGPTNSQWGTLFLTPPYGDLPPIGLDSFGAGSITVNVPSDKAGRQVWLQGVDISSLMLTNGVDLIIAP